MFRGKEIITYGSKPEDDETSEPPPCKAKQALPPAEEQLGLLIRPQFSQSKPFHLITE